MSNKIYESFDKILRITRLIAYLVGGDFLNPNYKINPLTILVTIAINIFFGLTLYTIYVSLVVNGDWKIMFQALSMMGSAMQGYSKLLCGIQKRQHIYSMYRKLDKIYKEHDDDFQSPLIYRTKLTTRILKSVMAIYIFVVFTLILYPFITTVLYDQKNFIMEFYLPSIDLRTHTGYVAHNVVQLLYLTMGGFGNFAADMLVLIFMTHVPLLKDVLRVQRMKLNRIIEKKDPLVDTMPMVKEIVKFHQNYNIYANEVKDAYYGVIFVQIFTSVLSISCTLFAVVIRSWPAAFSYLIYASCIGHLVEVSKDDVITIIYGEFLWYELSVAEQKLVLLMLRKSQAPTSLTVGQIMPLSMSTALQLTKAIYSYMMMLPSSKDIADEIILHISMSLVI